VAKKNSGVDSKFKGNQQQATHLFTSRILGTGSGGIRITEAKGGLKGGKRLAYVLLIFNVQTA